MASSWFNKRLSVGGGKNKYVVEHRAWFLCKLLCRAIDESTYDQIRSRLVQSSGVETRVRLTADGWTSGTKKTARNIPSEFYPVDQVEALTVDTVYANVLICVIRCFTNRKHSIGLASAGPANNNNNNNNTLSKVKFDNDYIAAMIDEVYSVMQLVRVVGYAPSILFQSSMHIN